LFGAYSAIGQKAQSELALLVDGRVPPGRAELKTWLLGQSRWAAQREAYLVVDVSEAVPVTFAELGLELDVDATHKRVIEAAPKLNAWKWLSNAIKPPETINDVKFSFHFDEARAQATLLRLRNHLHREPVNARLDLRAHRRIEHQPGRALDPLATVSEIEQGSRDEGANFQIKYQALPAKVTSDMLLDVDVSKVLSSYETDFAKRGGPRVINIGVAAEYLNGRVLGAGETLSFNQTVGERVIERGFVSAPVIVADEFDKGVGGGVCQVASTLFAASVLGGLDVLQRRSHSRPSGYAPLGLDAVVIDNEMDLKLRNPYDSVVIIHAFLPTKTSIRVELLGREAPGKIEHTYGVEQTYDFYRRVVTQQDLGIGEIKRRQKGSPGYDVVSTVRTTYPDGRVAVRHYPSKYYPVPEVFWIGVGTPLSELPPLPERATHVELDGAEVPGPLASPGEIKGVSRPL
jgi:vancomycin resistance protein YoaR